MILVFSILWEKYSIFMEMPRKQATRCFTYFFRKENVFICIIFNYYLSLPKILNIITYEKIITF